MKLKDIEKAKRESELRIAKIHELSYRGKQKPQIIQSIKKKKKKFKKRKEVVYTNYYEYLNSNRWKSKRNKILKRANNMCELCKIKLATQIHHKTYKRIFYEKMRDLVAVCGICHMSKHGLLTDEMIDKYVQALCDKEFAYTAN